MRTTDFTKSTCNKYILLMDLLNIFERCFEAFAQAEGDLYDPAFCVDNNSNCATFGGNDMVARAMMQLVHIVKTRNLDSLQEAVRDAPDDNNGSISTYYIMEGLAEQAAAYTETGSVTFEVNYNQLEIWTMSRIYEELNTILNSMVE